MKKILLTTILTLFLTSNSFAKNLPGMLPQEANPDYETLRYYHFRYLNEHLTMTNYLSKRLQNHMNLNLI